MELFVEIEVFSRLEKRGVRMCNLHIKDLDMD